MAENGGRNEGKTRAAGLYTYGYQPSVVAAHRARTVERDAAFFLPS
jgi:hypothetical protein